MYETIDGKKLYPEPEKKKGYYSKFIVAICILLVICYTGVCLYMQYTTGNQPESQLTICFFAFISSELWNLSRIKQKKNAQQKEKE